MLSNETVMHQVRSSVLSITTRLHISDSIFQIALAVLVGLGAGFLAVAFRWLINTFHALFFGLGDGALSFLGNYYVIFLPALGGLIVGPLIYFWAQEAKGSGVPDVMEAVALRGGQMRARVMVARSLASALSIGSGGSVGREGPIVHIGASVGSTLGQFFQMSDKMRKTLVGCGAAAGIAATFNAPIGGVFFALELVLGEFTVDAFSLIVVSAVVASVIGQVCFGDITAFQVPEYSLVHHGEWVLYVLLGVLAAGTATVFIRALYKMEDMWERISFLPPYIKPVAGGFLLGCLALIAPQVLGVGYESIESALGNQMVLTSLVGLIFLKIVATSLTMGSGSSGGVFTPSLFIGAMLGGAFGTVVHLVAPAATASPGAYALVGMGALFAGAAHAPMSAILILFELTQDYHIILPLMLASVVSSLVASYLEKESVFTLKLVRKGINLKAGKDENLMRRIRVSQAMCTSLETVTDVMTVGDMITIMQNSRHNGFPVLNTAGKLVGLVTLQDVRDTPMENRLQVPLCDIMSTDLVVAYPDESLASIAERFGYRDIGRLPVVDRDNPDHLVGLITRSDIIRAYNQASMAITSPPAASAVVQ